MHAAVGADACTEVYFCMYFCAYVCVRLHLSVLSAAVFQNTRCRVQVVMINSMLSVSSASLNETFMVGN